MNFIDFVEKLNVNIPKKINRKNILIITCYQYIYVISENNRLKVLTFKHKRTKNR